MNINEIKFKAAACQEIAEVIDLMDKWGNLCLTVRGGSDKNADINRRTTKELWKKIRPIFIAEHDKTAEAIGGDTFFDPKADIGVDDLKAMDELAKDRLGDADCRG